MWARTTEKQSERERKRKKDTCAVCDYKWGNNYADDPCNELGSCDEISLSLSVVIDLNQEVAELLHCGESC